MASPEVDYKSKIAELEQTIRHSERKIDELTSELLNGKKKLQERDVTIEKYEQRAEELEQQLFELRKGLEITKSSSLDVSASDVSTQNG